MEKVEQFIQEHTKNTYNYNSYAPNPTPWLTPDEAREAVEIAREKIYNWLDNNLALYDACDSFLEKCRLLKDLKQAMQDETQNL